MGSQRSSSQGRHYQGHQHAHAQAYVCDSFTRRRLEYFDNKKSDGTRQYRNYDDLFTRGTDE